MKVDAHLRLDVESAQSARQKEELGIAGLWSAETAHDPFVGLAVAATTTTRVDLGTAIAVAFARTPMTTAMITNDIHAYSGGRMIVGLGPQIQPHIENRYSMPWSKPARRMREYVLAMRAIWAAWNDGAPLRFEGDFYRHTLMTPAFSPPAHQWGAPPVYLSAVGPLMTEIAGEVADGLLLHPFSTERYIREVTLPALERGVHRANRIPPSFEVTSSSFVVTGEDEPDYERCAAETRQRIAFYASTPNYLPVLEIHGWGQLQSDLHRLARQGRWQHMGSLIDDEMLKTFAVCAEPERVADAILERYGDICDRIVMGGPPLSVDRAETTLKKLGAVTRRPRAWEETTTRMAPTVGSAGAQLSNDSPEQLGT